MYLLCRFDISKNTIEECTVTYSEIWILSRINDERIATSTMHSFGTYKSEIPRSSLLFSKSYSDNHDFCFWQVNNPGNSARAGEEKHVDAPQKLTKEARLQSIHLLNETLLHTAHCKDPACTILKCKKMKNVIGHTKSCERKRTGSCSICRRLIALCCLHAKRCNETLCSVSFCESLKRKMRQRRIEERLRQVRRQRGKPPAA